MDIVSSDWTAERLFSSKKQDWRTPPHVFAFFDEKYKFQLDAAATPDNTLCGEFLTPLDDALAVSWPASSVWVNPPYGRDVGKWMEKARIEALKGRTVGVLVFARTDTAWWHDHVMKALCVYLLRGRLKFIGDDGIAGNSATAPSCFVVFGPISLPGGPRFQSVVL